MRTLLAIPLGVWMLGGLLIAAHQAQIRSARKVANVLLGVLASAKAIWMSMLSLFGLHGQILVPIGNLGFSLSPQIIIPVIYLGVLAMYVSDGAAITTVLLFGLTGIMAVTGLILPTLDAITPWFESLGFSRPDGWPLRAFARELFPLLISFAVGLYVAVICYRLLRMRVRRKLMWLAGAASLLISGCVQVLLFSIGAFGWTEGFATMLKAEMMGMLLAQLFLSPLLAWYLRRLEERESPKELARTSRDVLLGTLNLRTAMAEWRRQAMHLDELIELLMDVRGLMVRASDSEQLLHRVCRRLTAIPRYKAAWISLAEGENEPQRLEMVAGGPRDRRALAVFLRDSAQLSPAATALRENRPVMGALTDSDGRQAPWGEWGQRCGGQRFATLPMLTGDGLSGSLSVCCMTDEGLGMEDVRVLQTVAGDLGHALSQLDQAKRQARRMRELEAIGELTTAMVTHHDMQTLLTALVTKSTDLLEGQAGILFLSDAEKGLLRVVVSYKSKKQYEGMTIAYGEGAAGIVAQSGEALIINDYRSWEGRLQPFKAEPISALLSVPLARQGQVVGVICISRGPKQPPFTAHDLKLLGLFANHAVVMLENARLIEDVQSRATQLEKLNQLGRLAIAVTDMQGLLDVVVREMRDLVGADGCGITIWDEEHQRAEAAATSASLSGIWEEEGVAESATALTDAVLHSRTPLYVASMQKAAHVDAALARRYPDTSILVLPMVVGEESLGAIFLIRKEGMGLGRDEISLCGQATGQVALAMAKIRALEAERKRSSELEALGKASLSLTSSLELHEVLHTIIGQTFSMVKADDVHTFLYDGEMLTFGAAQWAGGRHGKPYSEPRSNGITYTVARAGEAIVVPDVNAHPLYDGYEWGGAIAGFPLKIDGRVVGVMNVAFSQPHEFDTAELRAIELLADQAAIAVRNAHLFGTVDDERRRVQLLYDVTRELSQILDPQELMQRAIALATDSLRGQAGEVFLLQPGTDRLKLEATAGWDNAEIDALDARLAMRVGKGITGWVAEYGQPALLEDVEKDGRWLFIEGVDEDVRSAVCAPIIAGERLLGVMNIVGREPFPKEHLNLLVAISRQVGLALSHAERYQELRKRLAELTVLQQVVHAITRRLEMKPLLEEVVRQAGEVLGYPIVQIFLVQEGRMATGAAWGESSYDTSTLSMNKGITGKAVMLDQAIYVPDVSKDPDYVMAYPGTRSEFAVPLRQGDVIFGVLNVESPDLAGFDEQDMRMLTLLADQVSVAIENAALYERLRKDADELSATVAERTAELADALEEAREAERLKGQFVSDVSHELRTPLSNIRLYLELLAKGKTEKYAIYLETLSRETERLVALIEDLLAISRLDADMVSPAPELLKLNVLVRGLAEDRQRLLAEKGLDLQLMLEPDLPPVVGDERMISQVLANLMTNAMNYTPAGGRVSISTSSEQRDGQIWATLTVADTGVGIPHEERPHLFQRFFRGSAGRQMGTPGTGLGLAICKEILDRHGGYITVVSEPGRGSAFTVLLPASAVVMATQGPRMRSAHPQARPSDL